MNGLRRLKVRQFTNDRVPNPYPGGELPWHVFHTVRNAVVRACRQFGPVGPLGECPIDQGRDGPDLRAWERGDADPAYFIVDDQPNHERYVYAELYGDDPFNPEWLAGVVIALRDFSGWGLGVSNIPDAYVLIFGDRLLVKGPIFRGCHDALDVVEAARRQLRRGPRKWWQFWR
jgi:hypothetical protein